MARLTAERDAAAPVGARAAPATAGSASGSSRRSSSSPCSGSPSGAGRRWHPTTPATCTSGCRSSTGTDRSRRAAATFLLRSPVYGLALATGSSLVGGDPLVGARLVALGLSLLALAGALRLGWLLAGPGGAVGTAFALVAAALVWRLVPSLRIDLPQTAAIVATLLAVWRPTTRRWAVGGVLLGLAILIKETALPLLILPVALVGSVPPRRLARLAAVFIGAAVLTAAWWWVVVWASTGRLFPLNALSVIEARDVAVALRVDRSTAFLLVDRDRRLGARRLASAPLPGPGATPAPGRGDRAGAGCPVRRQPRAERAQLRGSRRAVRGRGRCRRGVAGREPAPAEDGGHRRQAAAASRRSRLVAVAVLAIAAPVVGQRGAGRVAPDRIGDELVALARGERPRRRADRDGVPRTRTDGPAALRARRRGDPADRPGSIPPSRPRPTCGWASATASSSATGGRPGPRRWPATRRSSRRPARPRRAPPVHPVRADGDARDRRPSSDSRRRRSWRPTETGRRSTDVDADGRRLRDARRPAPPVGRGRGCLARPRRRRRRGRPAARRAAGRRRRRRRHRGPARSARRGGLCDARRDRLGRPRTCRNLPGLTRTGHLGTTVAYLHRTAVPAPCPDRAIPVRLATAAIVRP